ncbi:DNA cross-link repair 1A protein [Scyliorhinus canicula]|uniref:DNA cross-link repair 1A protein n=1 Tax=Scyliorhinus canicula TaxID=7830 RepID=UPI0018F4BF63|nr:DNA cross-link repair 1A protein [Scyliorhinus canicula]
MASAEEELAIWGYRSVRKRPAGSPRAARGRGEPAPPRSRGKGARSRRRASPERGGGGAASGQQLSPPASGASSTTPTGSPPSRAECPEKKQTPRKARPVHDGHCPICQMPFSLLLIETPRWHVTECLDTPGCTDNECPDGLLCNNTIPNHYKRYSHSLLAEKRALGQSDVQSTFPSSSVRGALAVSPDFNNNDQSLLNSQASKIEEHLTNKNQNALLLLKSPAIKATKKSSSKFKAAKATKGVTSLSEKVSTDDVSPSNLPRKLHHSAPQLTVAIEPGINIDRFYNVTKVNSTIVELQSYSDDESAFVLASNANNNQDDISYSPICSGDIPDQKMLSFTRRRLFHGQTINHNCKLEDDTFSDSGDLKNHGQELFHKSSGFKDTVTTDIETIAIDPDSSLLTDSVNIITKNRKGIATQPQQAQAVLSAINWNPLDNENVEQGNNWSQSNLTESNLIKLEPVHSRSDHLLEPLQIKQEPLQIKQEPIKSLQLIQNVIVQKPCDCQTREEERCNSSCPIKTSVPQRPPVLPSFSIVKQGSSHPETLHSFGVQKSGTKPLEMASPGLLERGPIKIPKRSAINKELKQTDIGVFFGLQPKIKEEQECPTNIPQGKAKELISEVSYNERRQKQRKRKIEGSIGDEPCIGTVDKLQTELADGQPSRTKRQRSAYQKNKQCPFYKKIPGSNFTVDAFQYGVIEGCSAYFLTHFHSDHYGGLTKNFKCPIYCSTITGNLVISKLKVQAQYVTSLPMNSECVVDGVKVVLLDANHCPGAVLLLFQLPNGKTLLHTGDFRANTSMERYTHLMGQKIHTLYLDTTYCSPEYTFPSQQEAIQFAANVAFETVMMNPRTLIVCGTYSIGKEKVFLALAEVLGCKVCITRNKLEILQCLESEQMNSIITMDWENSQLHLLPMMQITFKGLRAHMSKFPGKYDHVVAFKPTGWTYSGLSGTIYDIKPRVQGKFTIYGIPYSEHSSYLEMKRFVQWLKPDKIIPTVNNGSWQERSMMDKIFNEWKIEAEQGKVAQF